MSNLKLVMRDVEQRRLAPISFRPTEEIAARLEFWALKYNTSVSDILCQLINTNWEVDQGNASALKLMENLNG